MLLFHVHRAHGLLEIRYVPDILEMLKKGKMEPLVPIPTISMVQAVCRLLEGLLPALTDKTSEVREGVNIVVTSPPMTSSQ